ncbi:hypothetical protein [Ehrlichia canis]|uniref:hypothetical protein n=1 Tax=Ehrlichia canis TaxID=944 RepID=UPI000308238D|nr:hypothetical protein [Ehrlichia canis]UKC53881.1 hypothetical protein s20019040002_000926 [Ehrlichia canis]UKC54818.1 hypothetical protein s20026770001_000925 [Ehrlichia canis]UKC55753.1 hypothetical protein s21009500007_000925 [Ehrlichia canis]
MQYRQEFCMVPDFNYVLLMGEFISVICYAMCILMLCYFGSVVIVCVFRVGMLNTV